MGGNALPEHLFGLGTEFFSSSVFSKRPSLALRRDRESRDRGNADSSHRFFGGSPKHTMHRSAASNPPRMGPGQPRLARSFRHRGQAASTLRLLDVPRSAPKRGVVVSRAAFEAIRGTGAAAVKQLGDAAALLPQAHDQVVKVLNRSLKFPRRMGTSPARTVREWCEAVGRRAKAGGGRLHDHSPHKRSASPTCHRMRIVAERRSQVFPRSESERPLSGARHVTGDPGPQRIGDR